MRTTVCALIFIFLSAITHADILLNAGETCTLDIGEIEDWVISASPDYPSYDHYSFTLSFSSDLYDSSSDDLRIRLYEETSDTTPYLTLLKPGTVAANFSTEPAQIGQFQVGGSLWHDFTGKIEVEVLSGSVQLDHLSVRVGDSVVFRGQMDVIPEPSSLALLAVGAGALYRYRRNQKKTGS